MNGNPVNYCYYYSMELNVAQGGLTEPDTKLRCLWPIVESNQLNPIRSWMKITISIKGITTPQYLSLCD